MQNQKSKSFLRRLLFLMFLAAVHGRLAATTYSGANTTSALAAYYTGGGVGAGAAGTEFIGYVGLGAVSISAGGGTMYANTVGILGGTTGAGVSSGRILFSDSSAKLVLTQDLICGSNFNFFGAGKIDGGGRTLHLTGNLTISSALTNDGADSVANSLTINGGGQTLTLSAPNSLQANSKGDLILKNMRLVLSDTSPISGGGTLYLQDVDLFLTTDVIFGSNVVFRGRVNVYGDGKILTSVYTNTIADNAVVQFNPGTTFRLQDAGDIVLAGQGSTLALNGCVLNITPKTGNLTLTKGMLTLANQVTLLATDKFVTVGDGATAGNNTEVKVLSDACVIVDGTFLHNPA